MTEERLPTEKRPPAKQPMFDRDPLHRVALAMYAAAGMTSGVALLCYHAKAEHIWPACLFAAVSGFYGVIAETSRRGRG